MKVAAVVPQKYLTLTEDYDYFLCLPQLIRKDAGYAAFFRRHSDKGAFVIIDNGAAEGKTVSAAELVECAEIVAAREVVLPDVLHNAKETLDLSRGAFNRIIGIEYGAPGTMGVAQGESIEEVLTCAIQFIHMGVDTLGIPKWLVGTFGEDARRRVLRALRILVSPTRLPQIHLLGCWGAPKELKEISQEFPGIVRGVDSSLPYVVTCQNRLLLFDRGRSAPSKVTDFEREVPDEDLLKINLARWSDFCHELR